jgi:BirA family biotin operon repressor/biotin-[acetyl-CoA-carboxylase] ligase
MALSKKEISRRMGDLSDDLLITVYKKIDSTNTRAKSAAESGSTGNAIFVATEQTAGRGRLGRSFTSNKGKGLYLTVLIGRELPADFATSLTTYMAVIAARAISALTPLDPKIKWVNDIYVGGKKLAGILTEGRAKSENTLAYAAVGIGINLYKQDFPEDVKAIATTVEDECGEIIDVNELTAVIVSEFFNNLDLVGTPALAEEYRSRSFLIGQRVNVIKPTATYEARVKSITDKCELLLELPDGTDEILATGEVSVRKI